MKASVLFNFQLTKNVFIKIGEVQIQHSSSEKPLGIKIDSKLNFKGHTGSIRKKASRKLNALTKVYMNPDKRSLIMKFFFSL